MSAIPIRFQRGDTLLICDIDGQERPREVRDREMSGYLLQYHGEEDTRTWSGDEILTVYAGRRLSVHFGYCRLPWSCQKADTGTGCPRSVDAGSLFMHPIYGGLSKNFSSE
jgi:hypothetical protein